MNVSTAEEKGTTMKIRTLLLTAVATLLLSSLAVPANAMKLHRHHHKHHHGHHQKH